MGTSKKPRIGFIGLGDQGLPMASAIAEAGYDLHVWARRQRSLRGLGEVPHEAHRTVGELASVCSVVELCVGTDEDVHELILRCLEGGLAAGSIVVNHGTGTPNNAVVLSEACAPAGVDLLDAPVSGGRPGAEARDLLTMVGGPRQAAERSREIFDSFSRDVVYVGGTGAGQTAKLLNNALLMLNQESILEILGLARDLGLEPARVIEVLRLGSADSEALRHFGSFITAENVAHLSEVEALDMELFAAAMADAGVDPGAITARGVSGAKGIRAVVKMLEP